MLSLDFTSGLGLMFLWGVATFLQSIPTRKIGTLKMLFISYVFSLLPTTIITIVFISSLYITLFNLLLLILAGILLLFGLYNFYSGIEKGDVSIIAPIVGCYSLTTVFLSIVFLREKLSFIQIISIFLIILGIVLASTDLRKLKEFHTIKGVKNAIIAMLFTGTNFFILGLVSKGGTYFGITSPPVDFISLFVFSTLINAFIFIAYVILKKNIPKFTEIWKKEIALIIFITSTMFAIAWIILSHGLSKGKVSLLIPISSLNPAITILLAVVFYKERLVLNQKIGILIVLLGLFLISM